MSPYPRTSALVAVTLWAWCVPAAAADYHLATTGDNANAATSEASFRTLRKEISVLKPGDTLYVNSGSYTELRIEPEADTQAILRELLSAGGSSISRWRSPRCTTSSCASPATGPDAEEDARE